MAKKVVGREMTSRVGLDSAEAVKSLKQLTAEVRANTSGWKAQETALKSAGEYQKAAAARVDGLAKSMEAQKAKIDELKSRQAGLNRDTKNGEEQYLKLADQINKASRSYDSMGGQLDRAKSKLQYYNSGLADLQKGYKQTTALSESYVKRLEAEGKSAEANKARLGGLKQAYSNMEAQYKAQTSELERIKNASGATSDAYKRQQVRVNETATSMAKLKSETNELDSAMKKSNASVFTRMLDSAKSKLGLVRDEEKKTKDETKHFAIGAAIGNTISNAASSAIGYMKGVTQEGYKLAEAGGTIKKQWTNLGLSDAAATKMTAQIGDIRSKANMSGGAIDQMQKKFYAMTNSATKARAMTEVLASYGSAAGKSGDQIAQLSQGVAKLSGSSKVTASLFKRTFGQVPELQKAIVKASGMSTDAFNKQLAAGKITGSQLQGYMVKAAKTSGKAWSEFGDTTKGKMAAIQGTYTNLKVAFAKPLVAGVEKAIDGISEKKGALDNVKKSLTGLVGTLGKKTGQYVGDVIKFLAKNEKPIEKMGGAFASIVGSLAKGAWSAVAGSLKLIGGHSKDASKGMSGVADATAAIAKHKTAIENVGKAIMVYLAVSKLKTIGSTLYGVAGAASKVGGALSRIVFKPKVEGETGKRELTLFSKAVKGTAKGIGKGLKWTARVSKKAATKTISVLSKTAKATGKGIVKALKFTAKVSSKVATTALNGLRKAASLTGKAFVSMGKFMLANPFVAIATAVIAISAALYELYKHNKKFRKFVNGIAKAVSNFTKNALKGIKKFFSNIGKSFSSFGKSFKKSWNKTWNSVKKFFSNIFNGIHKLFTSWGKTISKYWNSFSKAFKKAWNSYWKFVHDFYAGIFKKIAKVFKSWTSAISKTWNGFKNWFGKKWNSMWNGVHNFFYGITKKLSKTFSDWTSGAMNTLGSFGNKFKSGWNGLVKGVKDIFGGLWKDLKGFARDGMNDVIDIINKGIDGVDWVINKFGGKKKTIDDLSHVHFATGTGSLGSSNFRRAINSITPAIVNDEAGASNPELIFRKATGTVEYSKQKNAETMLFPGDEVANATDSARLAPMLGITHFAGGGIGNFFGGIINGAKSIFGKVASGLKGLFDIGTKILSDPAKALESLMPFSNGGAKGFFPTMVKGGFDFVKKQAGKWWSALWSMVSLSGDGSGSYGGGWQSPGSGWTHTDGFGSPRGGGVHDGNDFSASVGTAFHAMHGGTVIRVGGAPSGWGPVGYNIVTRDSTGKEIIYQEFGNAKDVRVHQGEHVKTGDTLGVLGRSGLGTGPHLHVGLTNGGSVWSRNGMSTSGWLDITKQHGKDKGSDADSDSSSSGDSSLQKMIKKQVGGGFWKTISKLASLFGDDGGSGDPGGSGVQRWKSDVKSALSKLGLSTSESMVNRVLRQINTESGGNPKAMGGTDGLADGHAEGLMQVKPGTFSAYHLSGHNNIWNGYDNMLAGLNYAKHRYGSGLSFLGNGHGYENGGIIGRHGLYEIAEHNKPEMVLPLTNKSRANQLIAQASQVVNGNNDSQVVSTNSESNKKLDKVIALLAALVSGQGNVQAVIAKSDVVNAVKSDNKTASQYSQMMGY
ncbi:tape measure protein [Pediococcus pentosaceus]|uniref:SLT domain protein n=1 Tax=Pediococcus pentosaceus (strain ATCC 25745 / CCUG 21536 / LMG 10740 / 183-1w) TaxID=278197 RepID=Q03FH3_PEDPA|nr:tape measure protein [Pediococcus pentosaceus]ABJ68049.1 SLT domain protein [Pediococcus pentosaceus ATCC 25745]QHM64412.1 Chromosome partition protein Smc [Pediococcus pentosaceus]QHM66130.1 Chromosome partition protein Smc [Pediococcus pentosaceus]QHM67969.1 Chromosome partition protein Smc [Pediococcus pentosaceus]